MKDNFAIQISVICPVHNAEKYLDHCLESLRVQTFQDFEVWLVNDGSTDRSGAICDDFVQKDARFHVLHKENGGPSSARNLGLEHANGKWICFVDSDDFVLREYLQKLYETVRGEETAFVIQGFSMVYSNGVRINREFKDKTYRRESIRNAFEDINLNRCGFPFAKVFENNIIQKYNIRFPLGIHYGEDKMFLWQYMLHVECLKTLSGTNYQYCIRSDANNLSERLFSYDSEYRYYQMYYDLTRLLMKHFDLTIETRKSMNNVVAEILIRRAIGTIYQGENRKSFKDRISILKNLKKEEIRFCQAYYKQCSWFRRLVVVLLSVHCYRLCDYLNQGIAWGQILKQKS